MKPGPIVNQKTKRQPGRLERYVDAVAPYLGGMPAFITTCLAGAVLGLSRDTTQDGATAVALVMLFVCVVWHGLADAA